MLSQCACGSIASARSARSPRDGSPETRIPAYCLSLTVHFTEEERYLIRHTGIGRYVFFHAPIPPDVTDPEKIKKLKSEDVGLFLVRDLLGFGVKTLLAVWPDLIAADEGEAAARLKARRTRRTISARRRDDGDLRRVRAVTLWENVWQQVAKEMPRHDPAPEDPGRLHRRDPRRPCHHRDLVSDPPHPRTLEVDRSLREARSYERGAGTFPRGLFPLARSSHQERIRHLGLRARRSSAPASRRFLRSVPKSVCRKHDAHRAANPGRLGTSRRHTLARSDAARDRAHEGRRALSDAPRLPCGRRKVDCQFAEAPR